MINNDEVIEPIKNHKGPCCEDCLDDEEYDSLFGSEGTECCCLGLA